MITSFIEGRIRIRANALKNPENMTLVMRFINAQDGIHSSVPNAKTGSVLVFYDTEKISRETLLEAAAILEKQLEPEKKKECSASGVSSLFSKLCDKTGTVGHLSPFSSLSESALMGGLFLLAAATGFTNKQGHIISCLLFAGAMGIHVYDRRRCLKP